MTGFMWIENPPLDKALTVHLYDILSQLDFYHNEKATVNITMTFLYFYLDVFYKEYNLNDYFV